MNLGAAETPRIQEPLLQAEGLSKAFGKNLVLRDLHLRIEPGSCLGLVGPNGTGKSTLFRCLLGLVSIDRGSVRLGQGRIPGDSLGIRRTSSFLPGENALYDFLTGREVLDFGLGFHDRIDPEIAGLCEEAFPLPLDQKVRTYSAGMKQQLALRIALSPEVPLLILDEPDKALDPKLRDALHQILNRLRAKGRTLFLATHHLEDLDQIAEEIAFLIHGKLLRGEVIAPARKRLERRVRIKLREGCTLPSLPTGVQVLSAPPSYILEPPPTLSSRELATLLLPLDPLQLEFGRAPLLELYRVLKNEEEA
ncbi:MAG TPA: ABC transporter ATP-binding protein [Planctomycetes bacterium]|nr:ABC transporter ATP-binding protein [Planctomycetota bacterium]